MRRSSRFLRPHAADVVLPVGRQPDAEDVVAVGGEMVGRGEAAAGPERIAAHGHHENSVPTGSSARNAYRSSAAHFCAVRARRGSCPFGRRGLFDLALDVQVCHAAIGPTGLAIEFLLEGARIRPDGDRRRAGDRRPDPHAARTGRHPAACALAGRVTRAAPSSGLQPWSRISPSRPGTACVTSIAMLLVGAAACPRPRTKYLKEPPIQRSAADRGVRVLLFGYDTSLPIGRREIMEG